MYIRQWKAEMLHVAIVNTDALRRTDIKTCIASLETRGCKVAPHLTVEGPGIAGVQSDAIF